MKEKTEKELLLDMYALLISAHRKINRIEGALEMVLKSTCGENTSYNEKVMHLDEIFKKEARLIDEFFRQLKRKKE